jgi:hypothetical protein
LLMLVNGTLYVVVLEPIFCYCFKIFVVFNLSYATIKSATVLINIKMDHGIIRIHACIYHPCFLVYAYPYTHRIHDTFFVCL